MALGVGGHLGAARRAERDRLLHDRRLRGRRDQRERGERRGDHQPNPALRGGGAIGLPWQARPPERARCRPAARRRWRVGVEQARDLLDLPAPDAELELPAAVQLDAALEARVDALEEPRERPEARRLDVHVARRERQPVDVGERVDGRVEREPVEVAGEGLENVGGERGILDHGVREAVGDQPVEGGIGSDVDRRADVVRLEVGDAHPAGRGERVHVRLVPLAGDRVDLELEVGRDLEPAADVLARRDDEAQRRRLAPDDLAERAARLAQREIEQRALEGPAPVVARSRHARLRREQLAAVQHLRRARDRVRAAEAERGRLGEEVVIRRRVADVLAAALVPAAAHDDRRRDALEVARHRLRRPLVGDVVDRTVSGAMRS